MVFYRSRLKKSIKVPPKFLDKNVRRRVRALVEEEAMEKGSPTLGQVVAVLDIKDEDISVGQVDHLDGSVRFEVRYDAVMFRVFVNEVIDGPVTVVHEHGFYVQCGPQLILVSNAHMPETYEFDSVQMVWSNEEVGEEIKVDTVVRLRVLSVRERRGNLVVLGSIYSSELGVLSA